MDIIDRAKLIDSKIAELEALRRTLLALAGDRAQAIGRYAVDLRVAIIKLRSEGQPVSIVVKLAEGLCKDSLVAKELAEGCYQVARQKQRAIEAELNGCQSIFRHLSHT